jgi:hypothetical protein
MKYKPKLVSYGLSLLTATAALVGSSGPLQAQEKKPNVVMLMIDDTGWADFGCYGGHIPGRFNKLGELRVSDIMRIHPKTLDLNEVSGPLVGKTLLVIGSHEKRAPRDPDHS